MDYYILYRIPEGKSRKDKKEINRNVSKKSLETEAWFFKKNSMKQSRFIITEVREKEVYSI